jgi:hypothetical protein
VNLNGETVTLIAQLENWRVLRVADRPGWGKPCWSIQRKVDGAWRDEAMFRVSASVREYLKARAGTIDAEAAAILARLPVRCDRDTRYDTPTPPPKRPRPPPEPAVKATPTKRPRPAGRRAALAASFMQWQGGKPVDAAPRDPVPNPPPTENNSQAARAASALVV